MPTSIAIKTNPKLWEEIKNKWIRSSKAGAPGKVSARKMQLAVQEYKRRGGGYRGSNKKSTSLHKWTKEDWGYIGSRKKPSKSRSPYIQKTYGRYLPKVVRQNLSPKERKIENARKSYQRGKWVPYSRSVLEKMHKYKIIKGSPKSRRTRK